MAIRPKISLIAGDRTTLIGVLYAIAALAVYQVAPVLNMLWLTMTTIPIAAYYILRWPHQDIDAPRLSTAYHAVGIIVICVWLTTVFAPEISTSIVPQWLKSEVSSNFQIANRGGASKLRVVWDVDGRRYSTLEGGSTWVASVAERRIKGAPLEETVKNLIDPIAARTGSFGATLVLLLVLVCGLGLYLSGFLTKQRSS
jgi:hypothetical protein